MKLGRRDKKGDLYCGNLLIGILLRFCGYLGVPLPAFVFELLDIYYPDTGIRRVILYDASGIKASRIH